MRDNPEQNYVVAKARRPFHWLTFCSDRRSDLVFTAPSHILALFWYKYAQLRI